MNKYPRASFQAVSGPSRPPGGGPLAYPQATQPGPQLSARLLSRMVDARISLCGMAGEGVNTWEA